MQPDGLSPTPRRGDVLPSRRRPPTTLRHCSFAAFLDRGVRRWLSRQGAMSGPSDNIGSVAGFAADDDDGVGGKPHRCGNGRWAICSRRRWFSTLRFTDTDV